MHVDDLIEECADALSGYPFDENRAHHRDAIETALRSDVLSSELSDLLSKAVEVFRSEAEVGYPLRAIEGRAKARSLAEAIRESHFDGVSRFLYHGTVYGRLPSISESGFIPGAAPVWKRDQGLRGFSDGAVFFTNTWRGAVLWAVSAHIFGRGPKAGLARRPVILRTPAVGLVAEPDPRANAYGCFMVEGVVRTDDTQLLVCLSDGLPRWAPLDGFIKATRRAGKSAGTMFPDLRPGA
jgi:hypothetical protein